MIDRWIQFILGFTVPCICLIHFSDLQSCVCRISLGDPSSAQAVALAEEKNVVPKPVAQCALILFIVI